MIATRWSTKVVGVTFRPGYHALADAGPPPVTLGDESLAAILVREPDNRYDPNAVAVHVPGLAGHMGYLARPVAARIASALDGGAKFRCEVTVLIHPEHRDRPGLLLEAELVPT